MDEKDAMTTDETITYDKTIPVSFEAAKGALKAVRLRNMSLSRETHKLRNDLQVVKSHLGTLQRYLVSGIALFKNSVQTDDGTAWLIDAQCYLDKTLKGERIEERINHENYVQDEGRKVILKGKDEKKENFLDGMAELWDKARHFDELDERLASVTKENTCLKKELEQTGDRLLRKTLLGVLGVEGD